MKSLINKLSVHFLDEFIESKTICYSLSVQAKRRYSKKVIHNVEKRI